MSFLFDIKFPFLRKVVQLFKANRQWSQLTQIRHKINKVVLLIGKFILDNVLYYAYQTIKNLTNIILFGIFVDKKSSRINVSFGRPEIQFHYQVTSNRTGARSISNCISCLKNFNQSLLNMGRYF